MHGKRFVSGIAIFGVETLFFVLIFLFLILEKTLPILGVLAGIIGLSLIGSRPRVRRFLDEGFARYKFWACLYGVLFVLALPVFLKNKSHVVMSIRIVGINFKRLHVLTTCSVVFTSGVKS